MKRLAALALAFAGASCGSTSYYDWGDYEGSVYRVTAHPDGFDLGAEIDALEQQIELSQAKERPIPPGLHAHLGYLYSVAGNAARAREHFEREKSLYPESAHFVDYLMAQLAPKA